MKKPFVVAIDGPSASGKGTLAKKIANHFSFPFLNTGAIYRLVAFRLMRWNFDAQNFTKEIPNLVADITESDLEQTELFTEEVGAIASVIAKNQNLRAALFEFQKKFVSQGKALSGGAVLDGRDTTTVICPDAEFKFFVTADVEIRAQRRFKQLSEQGKNVSYEEILAQLKKRDESDFNRADSPLKIAADAVIIDNGKLSAEEGFQKILWIRQAT
jgi:cytidylate kinase